MGSMRVRAALVAVVALALLAPSTAVSLAEPRPLGNENHRDDWQQQDLDVTAYKNVRRLMKDRFRDQRPKPHPFVKKPSVSQGALHSVIGGRNKGKDKSSKTKTKEKKSSPSKSSSSSSSSAKPKVHGPRPILDDDASSSDRGRKSSSGDSSRREKKKRNQSSSLNSKPNDCDGNDNDDCAYNSSHKHTKLHKPTDVPAITLPPSTPPAETPASSPTQVPNGATPPTASNLAPPNPADGGAPTLTITASPSITPVDAPVTTTPVTAAPLASAVPPPMALITSSPTTAIRGATPTPTTVPSLAPATTMPVPVPTTTSVLETSAPIIPPLLTLITGAPTGPPDLPTSAPVLGIGGDGGSALAGGRQAHVFTKTVDSVPMFLHVTGGFDPRGDDSTELDFFEVIRDNFDAYSRVSVGGLTLLLEAFEISVEFLEDLTITQETGDFSSWSEVRASYTVKSESISDLDAFTVETATAKVKTFFSTDENMERLIFQLSKRDIAVVDFELAEALPENLAAAQSKTVSDDTDGPPNSVIPIMSESTEQPESESLAWVAAVVSGGVIFLTLGAVIVSKRKKKVRQNHVLGIRSKGSVTGDNTSYHYHDDESQGMSFQSESNSAVQPAALHVRMKRERESRMAMSSDSTISSYRTSDTPVFGTPTKKSRGDFEGTDTYAISEDVTSEQSLVVPDGSSLVASRALTCLNGDESVDALNSAYPEFELYQAKITPPPSPVWSIDNFSVATPYSAEAEYLASRKRWHDETNDLGLIALPDHNSEAGYATNYSTQSAEDNNSESNAGPQEI